MNKAENDAWRLQRIIDASHLGTWEWNVQTGETAFNEVCAQIIGYTLAELAPMSIETWETFVHPDDIKASSEMLQRHFAGEIPYYDIECRMKHKDGHWVWVHDRGKVFSWTPEGQPLMMLGTHDDITGHKQAEIALRENQRFLENMLDTIPIPVFYKDHEGRYLGFNKAFELFFGKSKDELIGRTVFDINPPDLARIYQEMDNILLKKSGQQRYESQVADANGVLRDVIFKKASTLDEDGKITGLIGAITDITERKQAEEATRKSEEKYRIINEQSPIAIEFYDSEGFLVSANPACLELFGVKDVNEIIKFALFDDPNISDEHKNDLKCGKTVRYQAYFDFDKVKELNLYKTTKSGQIYLDILISTIKTGIETIGGYLLQIQDITERKQAETALKEIMQRLKLATSSSGLGVWDWDLTSNKMVWDDRMLELYGLTRETFLGGIEAWQNGLHPEDSDKTIEECQAALRGEKEWDTNFRVLCPDGTIKHIKANGIVVRDPAGTPVRMLGINVDITASKQAEDALRESEAKFSTAFQTSPYSIVITRSKDFTFVEVNDAFTSMMGFTRQEALAGSSIGLKIWVNEEDRLHVVTALGAGQTVVGEEYLFRTKSGQIITGLFSAQVLHLGEGSCILSSINDITENKQAEEEKAKLLAQLSQAQKMESVGLLAGGIAHDFNNMLSPILGFAELLLEDIPKEDVQHARAMEIYKSAQRASALVKHILAFSRQSNPERIIMNPAKIIKEVLNLARAAIPANMAIESDISIDCCRIFADPTQLHQIAMNLITNAYHAMEKKVVGTIRVELHEETSAAPAPGRYVCLRVSDTGSGIDALTLPRIFEPYFTTKPQGKGTGLGLSIIDGIVHEYGGEILVDSRLGEGTTFSVYLPLLENTTEVAGGSAIDHARGTEQILLVDDEEIIVHLEKIMLERLGYRVTGYTMSLEALDAFKSDPQGFDLVITDMAMPLMTGLKLAKKLLAIRPDLPILLCTGFSDQIDQQDLLAQGIRGLLMKPVMMGVLAAELRRILDTPVKAQIGGCVLVIDDEASIRFLFREKLGREGFEILEAENGAEGLKICRRKRPDLVITDLIMPDKEGIETIMEMKKEFAGLPIFAISGGGKTASPEEYLNMAAHLGACCVFAKPLDWPKLLDAVREILKNKKEK